MKKNKTVALILVLAMCFSLISACGSSTNSEDTTNDAASTSYNGNEINDNSGSEIAESVQRDVVNVAISTDVSDWSPWASGNAGRNAALYSIYQPLVDFVDGEYVPVLLKSYEVSEDEMSIDCELWPDIVDSEGNAFTSEDAVFHFEESAKTFTDFYEMIDYVEATGELTFTIYLQRVLRTGELKAIFVNNCVTKEAYEASEDGMSSYPVGTGPYVLSDQTSGYMFTLEKNENYWETEETLTCNRYSANVDTINFYVLSESSQRTIALEQGTVDICGDISSDDVEKFLNDENYNYYAYAANQAMVLFPNCDESSPCSDLNLRLAICYAISNEAVLNSVYNGYGTVMYSQVPNWVTGYNTDWETEAEDNYYSYDPETAAEYLAQSSYNGETLKIICASDENSTSTAQIVNNFLTQVGIASEVLSYDSAVFSSYIQDPAQWDIMVTTRTSSNGFYATTLFSDYDDSRFAWGGSYNFIYDETLQEYVENVMRISTSTAEMIDEAEAYIKANCYAMGMVNYDNFIISSTDVTSYCLSVRLTVLPGACTYSE